METNTKTPVRVGQRFGVIGGDAKGTVLGSGNQNVTYQYDHDLGDKVIHTHTRKWFEAATFPLTEDK